MKATKTPAVQTLRVLVAEAEISECQQMLASRLQEAGEFTMIINCGFNGGHKDIPAYWFPKEKFWWGYEKIEGEAGARHCNAFGLEEPLEHSKIYDITCQINVLLSNPTWRVAGALAKDKDGRIHLIHTGKIGGGHSGVGRRLFRERFAGSRQWAYAELNGKPKGVAVVSALDDLLVPNLARFIGEVRRIKDSARRAGLGAATPSRRPPPQRRGTRPPEIPAGC